MAQQLSEAEAQNAIYESYTDCLVEYWLAFLGHRWNALILYHLSLGPKRFGTLAECLPAATPKMLTERLAGLEARGLIRKANDAAIARTGEYALTPIGISLMEILNALEVWSRDAGSGYD